jgi:hypothetical protein
MIPSTSAGDSSAQKGMSGNISSIFDDKTGDNDLPRFSELKKTIWKDSMAQSWAQVLAALKEKAEEIESLGSKVGSTIAERLVCAKCMASQVIPRVHYDELQKGLSEEQIAEIKNAGVVIVRGAVPKEVHYRACILDETYAAV